MMDASSLYCPKCGALNAKDAETCFACGESILAPAMVSAAASVATVSQSLAGPVLSDRLLRGRYRLVRRIGEGGFGAVYQAEDAELGNRKVAIKEMSEHGLSPEELQEATEAFHREAILLAGLSHPSLPRIYDHFSEDGRWYLVMDFIEGETLEALLAKKGGRLSVEKTLDLGIKLCQVLEYLHSRQPPIIFRDLKPGNVMIAPDGQVYLIDFGIARLFKPGKDKDTIAFGSPGYAAPEQYGKAQTGPRSDIYSLGALLHHLLTGHDPSESPFRFAPLTLPRPPGTWSLIRQMVELDEYKRPPTMTSVRQALERLASDWAERRRTGRMPGFVGSAAGYPATGFLGPRTGVYPAVVYPPLNPPTPNPARTLPGQPLGAYRPVMLPPSPYLIQLPGPPAPASQQARSRWQSVLVLLLLGSVGMGILGGMLTAILVALLH